MSEMTVSIPPETQRGPGDLSDLRNDPRLIRTPTGPLILLFYDGFERPAREGWLGTAYSEFRRAARYTYRSVRRKQVWTGFYTAFQLLRRALMMHGFDVRVNSFAFARRLPHYPIGIAGYPSVLDRVQLSNPRIFGPGDYGYPDEAAIVTKDPRNRLLIQPCPWAVELYRPYCGEKVFAWPVGIDIDGWPDASGHGKTLDVVIYDKIRWHRGQQVPRILDRVTRYLELRGASYAVLRYGHHYHGDFKATLRRAKAMIFLCEHETQGLAYQEAMAMNVPVFAWDEGILVDPQQRRFVDESFRVSSVPYFDERCGAIFSNGEEFEKTFDGFWARLPGYSPRAYVIDNLSMCKSAESYVKAYLDCA
jgi:hypothetical protein